MSSLIEECSILNLLQTNALKQWKRRKCHRIKPKTTTIGEKGAKKAEVSGQSDVSQHRQGAHDTVAEIRSRKAY